MATNTGGAGTRQTGGGFLEYMTNARARSGRGLQAIDKAIGVDQPSANAGIPAQTTPQAATPADTTPAAPTAGNPPLTTSGPEVTEAQPPALRLLDQDRFYRDMGHLPTAADLAATQFATNFRRQMGRAPTKAEVVAHIYRRPDKLPQVTQDFSVG